MSRPVPASPPRGDAELVFYTGPMDCGKSTLALQLDHNHRRRGQHGLILTSHDRAGTAQVSSRLGLRAKATEVATATDLYRLVSEPDGTAPVSYVVGDEAQFYTPGQIDDLARVVDELNVPVYAFGILADFRTRLFPGSARLVELADRIEVLQASALCWCGRRATHNARIVDGRMATEGEQVVVGDTGNGDAASTTEYEVLCRRHHRSRELPSASR